MGTTEHGLNKLDPKTGLVKRFIHREQNAATISANEISSLLCDVKGNIWIGSAYGNIDVINEKTEKIKHIVLGGKGSTIRSIIQDDKGNIWAVSVNKIILIDTKGKINTPNFSNTFNTKGKPAYSLLYKDLSNKIWLGASGKLWQYNSEQNNFAVVPFTPPNFKDGIFSITAMKEERAGIFWIATDKGVFRFDQKQNISVELNSQPKFPDDLKKMFPRSITIDKTGVIWIGYGLRGLLSVQTFNPGIKTFNEETASQNGLPNNYVRGLAQEQNGNLWIGTYNGLARLDSSQKTITDFTSLIRKQSGKTIDQINTLFIDNKNVLWIGTNNLGLFSYSLNDGVVKHVLGKNSEESNDKDNVVFEIKPDRSNQLWISTAENGVVLLDTGGKIIRRYNKENKDNPLPNNHTRTVLEDGDGNIWIGTFAGLCKLNPATNQIITYTSDEKNPASLNDPFVISLFLDRHKRIWAGTRMGINIFEPDKNSFRHYTMADGLVNDVVVGFAEDSSGLIWVSTYGGLMVLDDSLKSMSAFFEADGLQNDLFNTGATLRLSSGELAFGGAHGLSIVSPNIINDRSSSPSVVVQAYKQSENSVSRAVSSQEKGFVTLEPGENRVRFEFAALDFRFSRGNIYSYKLEGLDNDWTTTFSRRSVTYTNLAAGDYLFRVRAAGRNGIWSEQSAAISLKVIPPIWKHWWFTPTIFILLVMAVFGFYRSLLMRKLQYERMRLQIAEDLHDEIGSGLARIAVLSDIIQKFIPGKDRGGNESELQEQAPNRIGVISRELLDSIQDVVWAIDPQNDNAENVFERIQIFATQLAEENEILISIETKNLETCKLGLRNKRAILLIAKESFTNIIRHAKAKTINLSLLFDGENLEMKISDDGVGFAEEHLERINGLHNMKRRAVSASGECRLSSMIGRGTIVTARFGIVDEPKNYPNVRLMIKKIKSKFTT